MAFNGAGDVLATGALDSTCLLWRVVARGDNQISDAVERLLMVAILPVEQNGVTALAFSHDDTELLACGDYATLKVWRLSDISENQLEQARQQWADAIPFTLSTRHSFDLLAFDDMMPSSLKNHEWIVDRHLHCLGHKDTLQFPMATSQTESILQDEATQTATADRESLIEDTLVPAPPNASDTASTDSLATIVDETERLRREFEKMEVFNFEQLLDPSAPITMAADSERSVIQRPRIAPDADGRLLRVFEPKTTVNALIALDVCCLLWLHSLKL
ncbi:hypothetical protein PINS_up014546 [Pythium insidiosum]|nr:hypothetical protein PINS_up014546 [Pythium insidiosum]